MFRPSSNTFEIKVNGESQKSGSLLEDFDPPFVPPTEIDDPEDKKPEDWVEAAKISDPDATKPDDWDEDAPLEIPDEDATMPDGWLEDEPATIPDPDAEKPEEWDDEEDGDWIPPSVPCVRRAVVRELMRCAATPSASRRLAAGRGSVRTSRTRPTRASGTRR